MCIGLNQRPYEKAAPLEAAFSCRVQANSENPVLTSVSLVRVFA